ncbi:hypothetical protein EMIT079MI2_10024 [Bacillus sp. IT-79MI2]
MKKLCDKCETYLSYIRMNTFYSLYNSNVRVSLSNDFAT